MKLLRNERMRRWDGENFVAVVLQFGGRQGIGKDRENVERRRGGGEDEGKWRGEERVKVYEKEEE